MEADNFVLDKERYQPLRITSAEYAEDQQEGIDQSTQGTSQRWSYYPGSDRRETSPDYSVSFNGKGTVIKITY